MDAHRADHPVVPAGHAAQRHQQVGVVIDLIAIVIGEQPLLAAKNLPTQRIGLLALPRQRDPFNGISGIVIHRSLLRPWPVQSWRATSRRRSGRSRL